MAGAALMLLTPLLLRLPLRLSLLVSEAALLMPAMALVMAKGARVTHRLGLTSIPRKTALLSVGAGIALWLTGLGVLELQYLLWKPDPRYLETFRRLFEQLRPSGPVDALWSVVVLALSPAFFEEALCRGLILPSFARTSRPSTAVVASALVFALLHLDPYRSLFAFSVGIGFGALRLRAGSTWAAFLAHSTLNTLTYSIALAIENPAPTSSPVGWQVAIACLAAGLLASYWIVRSINPSGR
jgi:membrane protease YdiL (CAAX protease family)